MHEFTGTPNGVKMKKEKIRDFHIRVLTDNTFILSEGRYEYGYDDLDELIEDLREDLSEFAGDEETKSKRKKIDEIMEEKDEED